MSQLSDLPDTERLLTVVGQNRRDINRAMISQYTLSVRPWAAGALERWKMATKLG